MKTQWIIAAILAIILIASISYSVYLGRKIEEEEKTKMELYRAALELNVQNSATDGTALANLITSTNTTIPIIFTTEKDSIVDERNLNAGPIAQNLPYYTKKLEEFKSLNPPVIWTDPNDPARKNRYYYGNTKLYNQVRYFPVIQATIIAILLLIFIVSIISTNVTIQDKVWVGMAKETAHQLGTPITSLQGWLELLKEDPQNNTITKELQKDVDRLKLVSDRFGKIGSKPKLEEVNILTELEQMIEYIKRRSPLNVHFLLNKHDAIEVKAFISVQLFDWVIENLLKNSLDAMEGKGNIVIDIKEQSNTIVIDIIDSGKGIGRDNHKRIFKPGFTTKKRGWGLGLSLSKRIIEKYHGGKLLLKYSEVGKGTAFRIILRRFAFTN